MLNVERVFVCKVNKELWKETDSSYFKLTGLWKDQLGSRLAFDSTAQK